jgi:hypothetical protein
VSVVGKSPPYKLPTRLKQNKTNKNSSEKVLRQVQEEQKRERVLKCT